MSDELRAAATFNEKIWSRIAFEAVEKITFNLSDRRGLRQVWERLDVDIRAEIKAVWREIIRDCIASKIPSDDGEPVTEEWLRGIGFETSPEACDAGGAVMHSLNDRDRLFIWHDGSFAICTEHEMRIGDYSGPQVIMLRSRGHVRRLLAALGIEGKR